MVQQWWDCLVVRVKACALNFLEIFTRNVMPGEPTPLPHITGGDVAGDRPRLLPPRRALLAPLSRGN